jgi:DNA/RNA-binding domain of Phe-tRNA-synthetase-like protein
MLRRSAVTLRRHAEGDETYEAFSGAIEHRDRGEVSFVDSGGRAHARRWTNRQSGYSAVWDTTSTVLIVAEAMRPQARTSRRSSRRSRTN